MSNNSKKHSVLLIIPAFNEEENILSVCDNIKNYNQVNDKCYDFIIINDGSTDNTEKICLDNNIPHISLINNLGIGGAVQTGYIYALENDYDIAIQFDGDGQHDINYVNKLVKIIEDDKADFVIGSRFVEKLSKFRTSASRRVGINIISFFIKLTTGNKIYDTTSGFRACNKKIIKEFSDHYPVEYPEPITTVELSKKGYRIKEIAVNMKERKGGKSSIRTWKSIYYMINVILSILIVGSRRYK